MSTLVGGTFITDPREHARGAQSGRELPQADSQIKTKTSNSRSTDAFHVAFTFCVTHCP